MQSLSGHTSGIDSVSFDSSEALVAAGAASGTIKLWDLEEAKSMLLCSIKYADCILWLFYQANSVNSSLELNLLL